MLNRPGFIAMAPRIARMVSAFFLILEIIYVKADKEARSKVARTVKFSSGRSSGGGALSTGAIIGLIFGIFGGVLIIVLLIWFFKRRRS